MKELAANPDYRDSRPASVNGKGIVRTRGRIPAGWRMTFVIQYDARTLEASELVGFLQLAGFAGGMGDYRPRFGRFIVVKAQEV